MPKKHSDATLKQASTYTGNLLLKSVANNVYVQETGTDNQQLEDTGGFSPIAQISQHVIINAVKSTSFNKPVSQMTAIEKMAVVREGISKKDLEHLKNAAELDYDQLAWALSVTRATLINKKGSQKFNSALSERIVSLADIYSYGYEVFDDDDKFNDWVLRPNRALGGQAPYDLLDNQYGREEVKNLIGRIDYGVYS